jgi:Undecaprenyl-phosphate galactose phosphotransferase WbaP
LPTQQVSDAADKRLPKIGAQAAARPHLVSSEFRPQASEEVGFPRDGAHEYDKALRLIRVRDLRDQDISLLAFPDTPGRPVRDWGVRDAVKRALDIIGAIVLGLVFLPLIIVITVLLQKDGGPVIYRHRRVGRDGRSFECLKFRSMVPDADRRLRELLEQHPELRAEWLRDHKLRSDPRITALGRFLRRTSLDELPQIWNVICGEMSLVGPRPVVREELMRYGRCLPVYLSVKPGITGLWQVMGRNDTDYRRRVVLDVYYVRRQNLLLDLYILLKTTRVVLGGGGAY